ncbi:hypothetical protein MTO96_048067 [Rhipicephalus appendiculatus]
MKILSVAALAALVAVCRNAFGRSLTIRHPEEAWTPGLSEKGKYAVYGRNVDGRSLTISHPEEAWTPGLSEKGRYAVYGRVLRHGVEGARNVGG